MDFLICNRCRLNADGDILNEIVHSENRSLAATAKRMQQNEDTSLGQASERYREERLQKSRTMSERFEEELNEHQEDLFNQAIRSILEGNSIEEISEGILGDHKRKSLEDKIANLREQSSRVSGQDVRNALGEYEREGYIEIVEGEIKITSRGARRLAANILEKILSRLMGRGSGEHQTERMGLGSEILAYNRAYEVGDDYYQLDIERTALNAVARSGKLEFEPEDFETHEEAHQTMICAGLLVDESGSMRSGHKLEAAIETTLALSELISKEPKDKLKIFIFSDTVKEIPPWHMVNEPRHTGSTDIRAAMQMFRKSVINEKGDKQAYLITDSEPNTEDGRFIGFEKASAGVIEEAANFRRENIGLNIIMLDQTPSLRKLASEMAKRNLGRVFLTSPDKLSEVLVEDYLRVRKGRI